MDFPANVKPRSAKSRGPRAMACYICGTQFGLNSYSIHTKQCKKLFEARENKKPPGERKATPQEPASLSSLMQNVQAEEGGLAGISNRLLHELNQAANTSFSENGMVACENCGRTFLEEKLEIHQRSCRATSPARRVHAPLTKREGGASGASFKDGSIRRSVEYSCEGTSVITRPKTASGTSRNSRSQQQPSRPLSATQRKEFVCSGQESQDAYDDKDALRSSVKISDYGRKNEIDEVYRSASSGVDRSMNDLEVETSMAGSMGNSSNMNAMRKHSKQAGPRQKSSENVQYSVPCLRRFMKSQYADKDESVKELLKEKEYESMGLLLKKVENIEQILKDLTSDICDVKRDITCLMNKNSK